MEGYEKFKGKILKLTGLDLSLYKEKQMKRRLDSRISRYKKNSYDEFYDLLVSDKNVFDDFMGYLTINVSEFYRNPQQWKVLENQVLPELMNKSGTVKVWSAACSTGEEPYTLVMVMSRLIPLNKIKVLAVDIDDEAINKAKIGVYSAKALANLPVDLKNKYFKEIGGTYKIADEIKNKVEFKKMNLLADNYPSNNDLIVCRNVMIYFTDEAKDEMYMKFNKALNDNGYLFVGSTEQMVAPKRFNFEPKYTFFYKNVK